MLDFLRRNQVLAASFFCVFFSLYILAAAATGRLRKDPVGPFLVSLMRPFQIAAQSTSRWFGEIRRHYVALRGLAVENERLRERLLALEGERNRLLEAQATNRRLRDLLEFRSQLRLKSVIATVVGNSASTWFRTLILNRGSQDGIEKGMAVVSPLGVVGQVVAVTGNSAKVLLLTDPHSGADVVVQRSRARGLVSGSLDNGSILKYVHRGDDVQEGDRLITSGLDGVFPKGLLVGTVTNVQRKTLGLFQQVAISLAVDPSRLEEVLVVLGATSPNQEQQPVAVRK